jgi:glutathione S-transferase
MLTIHHLGHSQSERIVRLCEELGIPYELRHYRRDAVTRLSPPELRALHPLGAAPLIEEENLLLAESAAIVEYIIAKHGDGRLRLGPSHCSASANGRFTAARWLRAIRISSRCLIEEVQKLLLAVWRWIRVDGSGRATPKQ